MEQENNLNVNDIDEETRQNIIKESEDGDNNAEKVIVAIAYIILSLGIAVCFLAALYFGSNGNEAIASQLLFVGIPNCIIIWAVLICLANISKNIRTIKHILLAKNNIDLS